MKLTDEQMIETKTGNPWQCPKCKGTGLLPFKKDGKVVAGAFVYCECHEDEPECYYPYSPDLIDYPVSWDFHRHYQNYYGQPDPGPDRPEQASTLSAHPKLPDNLGQPYTQREGSERQIEANSLGQPEWSNRQWDKFQQLQSEIEGWRKKHAEVLLGLDRLKKQSKDVPF